MLRTSRGMRPSTAWVTPIWMQMASRHLPKAWDSGSHSMWTSSPWMKSLYSQAAPMYVQEWCSISTPLGVPVVPEV